MNKLRVRKLADGRIGFPEVVEYEIAFGPRAGERLPVPLFEHNLAFYIVVHDQAAYEALYKTGWLSGEEHCGRRGPVFDQRRAPGA